MWGAILGAGLSYLGSESAGDNSRASAEENARRLREQGRLKALRVRRKGRQMEGALMIGIAASGFSTESKSALSAIAQNTRNIELDAEMAKNNAEGKASAVISQGNASARAIRNNALSSAVSLLL